MLAHHLVVPIIAVMTFAETLARLPVLRLSNVTVPEGHVVLLRGQAPVAVIILPVMCLFPAEAR